MLENGKKVPPSSAALTETKNLQFVIRGNNQGQNMFTRTFSETIQKMSEKHEIQYFPSCDQKWLY